MAATIEAVIITHERLRQLERCVGSLLERTSLPVLVVLNGEDAGSEAYLATLAAKEPRLRWFKLPPGTAKSRARNAGVEHSSADILYFLDDDAFVDRDCAGLLREKFGSDPCLAVVGGPNLTPGVSTPLQRAAGHLLASPFVAWKMSRRYAAPRGGERHCDDRMLILCNMAVRRQALLEAGIRFDERLRYNEENLLLRQLAAAGRRLLYCPELVALHERRGTAGGFARQVFSSGLGRARMSRILPASLSVVHVLPSLFLLYLLALPFSPVPAASLPLWLYAAAGLLNALHIAIVNREGPLHLARCFLLSFVAHLSYGTGFICGLLEMLHGTDNDNA